MSLQPGRGQRVGVGAGDAKVGVGVGACEDSERTSGRVRGDLFLLVRAAVVGRAGFHAACSVHRVAPCPLPLPCCQHARNHVRAQIERGHSGASPPPAPAGGKAAKLPRGAAPQRKRAGPTPAPAHRSKVFLLSFGSRTKRARTLPLVCGAGAARQGMGVRMGGAQRGWHSKGTAGAQRGHSGGTAGTVPALAPLPVAAVEPRRFLRCRTEACCQKTVPTGRRRRCLGAPAAWWPGCRRGCPRCRRPRRFRGRRGPAGWRCPAEPARGAACCCRSPAARRCAPGWRLAAFRRQPRAPARRQDLGDPCSQREPGVQGHRQWLPAPGSATSSGHCMSCAGGRFRGAPFLKGLQPSPARGTRPGEDAPPPCAVADALAPGLAAGLRTPLVPGHVAVRGSG